MNKSKLEVLTDALKKNPKIAIVDIKNDGLSASSTGAGHYVTFYIAPSGGGLFTAAELTQFMRSTMPPGIRPSYVRDFEDHAKYLKTGDYGYSERVGTLRIRASS